MQPELGVAPSQLRPDRRGTPPHVGAGPGARGARRGEGALGLQRGCEQSLRRGARIGGRIRLPATAARPA